MQHKWNIDTFKLNNENKNDSYKMQENMMNENFSNIWKMLEIQGCLQVTFAALKSDFYWIIKGLSI